MTATRYTAQGKRDAAARRAAQLEERRRHIATLTADEFLTDVVVDEPSTPQERAEEGIARAAAKWTDDEVAQVDAAIATVAARKVAERAEAAGCQRVEPYTDDVIRIGELTTADVWAELGPGFPVTKGIAGRMTAARNAGLIENTGRTTYPPKDAPGPNNGQRLTVWRAL